jgi:scyllo-inositol 2-dehydrogenase (NAD+)
MVRSLTRGPGLPPAWANDLKTSNGMLAEVNSHDFDAVRWLSGSEYVEVHVRAAARKRPDLRATLPDFYDVAVVSAVMKNGAFGIIDGVCPRLRLRRAGRDRRQRAACSSRATSAAPAPSA